MKSVGFISLSTNNSFWPGTEEVSCNNFSVLLEYDMINLLNGLILQALLKATLYCVAGAGKEALI